MKKSSRIKIFEEYRYIPKEPPQDTPPVQVYRSKPNFKKAEAIASEEFRHRNFLIRQYYYRTLKEIKQLIQYLPEESDRLVYERCRRAEKGNEENVHDFFSPQIRFHLICHYDLQYYIHYTIGDSSLKEPLTKMLRYRTSSFYNMVHVTLQPDFNTYYHNVIDYQKDHIHILPFGKAHY
ncbi:hypothetical protein [Desertivirga xinjiangensis]|uniref:hypothetical protein n=1 Tax=Desertivirga xinjiangensis TaxID=539206 RepID=UPI00210EF05E|nr:hypothetical protein [Pedobacter xinjiangensis]